MENGCKVCTITSWGAGNIGGKMGHGQYWGNWFGPKNRKCLAEKKCLVRQKRKKLITTKKEEKMS